MTGLITAILSYGGMYFRHKALCIHDELETGNRK